MTVENPNVGKVKDFDSLKTSLYPKTKRHGGTKNNDFMITEKLDGSNLSLFKFGNELYIAQRNNIFKWKGEETDSKPLYKGLHGWLIENADNLLEELHETSCIVGEWIGMGRINYQDHLKHRFYMFAKANVQYEDGRFVMNRIHYDHDLFIYPFKERKIPEFMDVVRDVERFDYVPSVKQLDELYDKFNSTLPYTSEGFIILSPSRVDITKYVRLKNGIATPHKS